jgi:hypothetical protein
MIILKNNNIMSTFFIPEAKSTQSREERKLYTGLVSFKLLPYVNPNNEQLKEMGFYAGEEEANYEYAKGDRIVVGLMLDEAQVYDKSGVPTNTVTLKHKENFFLSHTAAWPKEKDGKLFSFVLTDAADVKWVELEKSKDGYKLVQNDKTKDVKEFRMFESYGQTLAFNFFYAASGWLSHNIGIKKQNNDIKKNWTAQKLKKQPLSPVLPFGGTDGDGEFHSTNPFQIFDMLFPKVNYVVLQDFVKAIAEQGGGVSALLGVSFRNDKVYQTIFSEYNSIGYNARPGTSSKFAETIVSRLQSMPVQDAFFNTTNMALTEWTGDTSSTSNVSDEFGDIDSGDSGFTL